MADRAGHIVKPALRRLIPLRVRDEVYQVKRLGTAKYASYARLRCSALRQPRPRANAPFEIGGAAPIVLHSTTVSGVRSHWRSDGQGLRELRAFKREAGGCSLMVDVGAGAGIFSAAFCALTGGRAFAFEPSPSKFEELKALIGLNPGFAIEAYNRALGATEGRQAVSRGPSDMFRAVDASVNANETMSVQTLDGFLEQHGITPDFAKVDVEGMELEVLRGGAATFRRSVRVLLIEVHPSMLLGTQSVDDVQALLTDLGFRLFTLDLRPISDLAALVEADPELGVNAKNIVCRK